MVNITFKENKLYFRGLEIREQTHSRMLDTFTVGNQQLHCPMEWKAIKRSFP